MPRLRHASRFTSEVSHRTDMGGRLAGRRFLQQVRDHVSECQQVSSSESSRTATHSPDKADPREQCEWAGECATLTRERSCSLVLVAPTPTAMLWQVSGARDDKSAGWCKTHEAARRMERLPAISWRAQRYLTGVPPLERPRDVLDLCYQRYWKATEERYKKEGKDFQSLIGEDGLIACRLFADLSQDGRRKAFAPHLRSMCSSSAYYTFDRDRMISPWEHLEFLGWHVSRLRLDGLTLHAVRDLAGEAMAAPSIGLAVTSLGLQMSMASSASSPAGSSPAD